MSQVPTNESSILGSSLFCVLSFPTRLQFCQKTRQNAQSNNDESFFVVYKVLENVFLLRHQIIKKSSKSLPSETNQTFIPSHSKTWVSDAESKTKDSFLSYAKIRLC